MKQLPKAHEGPPVANTSVARHLELPIESFKASLIGKLPTESVLMKNSVLRMEDDIDDIMNLMNQIQMTQPQTESVRMMNSVINVEGELDGIMSNFKNIIKNDNIKTKVQKE